MVLQQLLIGKHIVFLIIGLRSNNQMLHNCKGKLHQLKILEVVEAHYQDVEADIHKVFERVYQWYFVVQRKVVLCLAEKTDEYPQDRLPAVLVYIVL